VSSEGTDAGCWIPACAGMTKASMDDTGGRKKAGERWTDNGHRFALLSPSRTPVSW